MIALSINIREEYLVKVENICCINNMYYYISNNTCLSIDISGTPEQITHICDYVKKLERSRLDYRMSKNFLWRIFN